MKQVYSALHPTEAYLVKGLLESHGIESEVRGDILFSARGELPITAETAPSVWILEERQFAAARKVIHQYEKNNAEDLSVQELWTCGSCGEKHGEQFSHCWKCGRVRQQ